MSFARQQAENDLLRSQFAPDQFWDGVADDALPRELMFGQVAVGALVSDIVVSLGVRPNAMIGLSLGESAGLFGVRAWRDRDADVPPDAGVHPVQLRPRPALRRGPRPLGHVGW